jgi:hypothetical protein
MGEITKRIPIFFRSKDGQSLVAPSYKAVPIVRVVFRLDTEHDQGKLGRIVSGYNEIDALVDTGADLNFADPALLASAGTTAHQSGTVSGATSTAPSTMHLAHLFFPQIGWQVGTDFMATPLRAQGRKYDLVLGLLLLQLGTLHMDFKRNEFYIDVVTERTPA